MSRRSTTYVYDPVTKKMVCKGKGKLPEKVFFDEPRFYENLDTHITGEHHKRDVMREQGVVEV